MMKKLVALVLVLAVVALCVFAALKATDNSANTTEDNDIATEIQNGSDITEATTVTDADGKVYYVGPTDYDAYQLALEGDMQERIDAAIMGEFMVYDIIREGDSLLQDADGKEINLCYGISSQDMPEEVTILRDGFAVFTWDEEEFEVSDKTDKVFVGASDSQFTSRVFCEEHKAIWARELTGYPESLEWAEGTKKGIRGPFKLAKLDNQLFDAFVLVQRVVLIDDEEYNAYTWVVRTCGCNQPGDEEGTPVEPVNPTPTQAPTQEPTEEPTQEPTQEPTEEPEYEPTGTPPVKVTPTPAATATPAPEYEPTGTPPVKVTPTPAATATPAPEYEPTGTPPVKVTPTPVASEETFEPEYSATEKPPVKVTAAPTVTASTETFTPEYSATQNVPVKVTATPVASDETFEVEESNETFETETVKSATEQPAKEKATAAPVVTESGEVFTPEYSVPGDIPAKVG